MNTWDYGDYEAAAVSETHGEIRCGTLRAVKRVAKEMLKNMPDTLIVINLEWKGGKGGKTVSV